MVRSTKVNFGPVKCQYTSYLGTICLVSKNRNLQITEAEQAIFVLEFRLGDSNWTMVIHSIAGRRS
jgi:hypothetical protein